MGTVIHGDLWAAAQAMPEKQRPGFIYAICAYTFDRTMPKGNPAWLPTFIAIKERLDMSAAASERGRAMANARWGAKHDAQAHAQANAEADAQAYAQAHAQAYAQASDKHDAQALHRHVCTDFEEENGKERSKEKGKEEGKRKETEISKDISKEKEKAGARAYACAPFVPPSIEEVDDFAASSNISIDSARFCDYFAAQGWKLSNGNKMKDWRAAARNWARRNEPKAVTYHGEYD